LTGALEETNKPYAVAKIAGIVMAEAYLRQYGCRFISCMPTNLYGPHDTFDLELSHVVPALIKKCVDARKQNMPEIAIWGTGKARREFLYVDDCAQAALLLMNSYEGQTPINIGTGSDVTICELAQLIKEKTGFLGELCFQSSQPEGTPIKQLNVSKINQLGWHSTTGLEDGLEKTINWYEKLI
jgi:GDP-L-fucose synthase